VRLASVSTRSFGLVATQTFTFLLTDIEDPAAMAARLGDVYAEMLAGHHRPARTAAAQCW
jgi:hypothetical protein